MFTKWKEEDGLLWQLQLCSFSCRSGHGWFFVASENFSKIFSFEMNDLYVDETIHPSMESITEKICGHPFGWCNHECGFEQARF